MAKIDSADRAERLALAIASDIALYNQSKLEKADASLDSLSEQIAEAREFYQQRVSEEHYPLFDIIVLKHLRKLVPVHGPPEAPPLDFGGWGYRAPPSDCRAPSDRRVEASDAPPLFSSSGPVKPQKSSVGVWLVIMLVLAALAVGAALLSR